MEPNIARKLINLNHHFYQSFAKDFSETRERLQLGVIEVLNRIPANCSVLDLGCGNGNVVTHLSENGFQGTYLGVDFSLGLLNQAEDSQPDDFQIGYHELDLTSPSWERILPSTRFDVIC
ncbi:MAG: class I SAM-dependent methyltransferase, partial [Anaerolineales bacterium]